MSKISALPPSGFRDFNPEEASARQNLTDLIGRVYLSHGFQRIGMPVMENLSTLHGKGGGADNEKLIFKVLKRGEELNRALAAGEGAELADMGMRFDLTLPLARYYARFREGLPKPFKVFQVGSVWRADRPQKGRYREFVQCDVDIVGAKEIGAEVDCIQAILEVFQAAGLSGVEVHINDRRLLAALRGSATEAQWAEALVALDKLDKVGIEGVEKELNAKLGAVPDGIRRALGAPEIANFESVHSESTGSIAEIVRLLQAAAPDTKIVFNPSLVRGQDYYTGTIFEVRHPELSGSLGGGGRYNRLLEVFGAAETPAFGGSIGFERLFLLLQEKAAAADTSNPQIFIPLLAAELRAPLLALASELRARGIRVDIFPDAAKLKNQFKYADDRKIPYTLLLGGDELARGEAKVKNMAQRSEETIALEPRTQFLDKMETLCKQ
jgi:histidyl-tRNA synthetase